MKARYPILKTATIFDFDTQVDTVVACCVLHNFIRLHNGEMTLPDRATMDINESNMHDVPDGDAKYKKDVMIFNNLRQSGNEMRDAMAMQMWADYIARR